MRKMTAKELRSMINEELERVNEQSMMISPSMAQAVSDAGKPKYQPRSGEPTHVNRNRELKDALKRKVKMLIDQYGRRLLPLEGEATVKFDLAEDRRDLYVIGNVEVETQSRGWKEALANLEGGFLPDLKPSDSDIEPGYYYTVYMMG